jgi:hypothetical protein
MIESIHKVFALNVVAFATDQRPIILSIRLPHGYNLATLFFPTYLSTLPNQQTHGAQTWRSFLDSRQYHAANLNVISYRRWAFSKIHFLGVIAPFECVLTMGRLFKYRALIITYARIQLSVRQLLTIPKISSISSSHARHPVILIYGFWYLASRHAVCL